MCGEGRQTLLVLLPGAAGRHPVLERLQTLCCICVLVPSTDLCRSSWAKSLVGGTNWIQWSGTHGDVEVAWLAVESWLQQDPSRTISGVMTYDEFGVELCSYIGERLGLVCTPSSEVGAFRDKHAFRERCRSRGIQAVRFARIVTTSDVDELLASTGASWQFPCVLKPAKGAGSWHVMKVESPEQLRLVFDKMNSALSDGFFPQEIKEAGFILEEYFAGHEVDIDGFARDGTLEFCMVSDNRPALEPYFLELGGIYPSQLPEPAVDALEALTKRVVSAFSRVHGCFHFEAKINLETLEAMPIEFNARCGGAECPASVEAVSGYYLPEVGARLALQLPVVPSSPKHAVVASTNIHVFQRGIVTECCDQDVDADACKLVVSVLFGTPGQQHIPNNGSQSCLGFQAVGGCTASEAEQNLQKAISQTRITVNSELKS